MKKCHGVEHGAGKKNHSCLEVDALAFQQFGECNPGTEVQEKLQQAHRKQGVIAHMIQKCQKKRIKRCVNIRVIFYSDNGGKNHTQNLPLRAGKASVYEGGIRVPMIVRWPGKVVADTRINTPVNNEDIFPTILEMAEIDDYKIQQELDGRSLVRLFTAGSKYVATAQQRGLITTQREANRFVVPKSVSSIDPQRPIVVHYPHQYCVEDTPDIDFMSAVRVGDWKLVYRMHEAELELYNLRDDIGERNNLAASMPEKRDELATTLSKKLREWDAPMPTIRATAERVPMPDEL